MVDNQHWLDRWREDRIGFHEADVNRHLRQYFADVTGPSTGRVFLPLCGKALDIHWIAQQGYEVIGIELSRIAVEAFFEDNELSFSVHEDERFRVYQAQGIKLLQGDFFDLRAADLEGCGLVYDRAALIALEVQDRPRYYEHMLAILPPDCKMLLITLEYDQAEMRGPPFSVPTPEMRQYYQEAFSIKTLLTEDIIDERPRWRKVGLTALRESVFSLTR